MLTKCTECGLQISDQASQCPHCGYPIAKFQRKADAINAVVYAKQKVINTAPVFVEGLKRIGVFLGKAALLLVVLAVLVVIYKFINGVADDARAYSGNYYYRPFMNLFMPFFWMPIFITVIKLFGRRTLIVTWFIYILLVVPSSIIVHVFHLLEGSRLSNLTPGEFTIALLFKVIGLFTVAFMGYYKTRTYNKVVTQ